MARDEKKKSAAKARHRERNRAELARRQREWNAANPEKVLDGNLRKSYGMTLAQYDARHAEQGGACAICGDVYPARKHGATKRLCVDHDHTTGQVRDLLCAWCNSAIGLFRDDPDRVSCAAIYLRRWRRAAR